MARPMIVSSIVRVYKVSETMPVPARILYCHCAYAQVVPPEVKAAVLQRLCQAGVDFEAVADLCEMSARRDPSLGRLAESGPVKIAACYPRAVKWLFAAAQAPLSEAQTEVLNMRQQSAETVTAALLEAKLTANLSEDRAAPVAPGQNAGQPN